MFSTWLSEYPEDFKSLGDPSRLLRLAPLLPHDSSSAADLRARFLRIAEELSEKALLPDTHKGLCFNWDLNDSVMALFSEVIKKYIFLLTWNQMETARMEIYTIWICCDYFHLKLFSLNITSFFPDILNIIMKTKGFSYCFFHLVCQWKISTTIKSEAMLTYLLQS